MGRTTRSEWKFERLRRSQQTGEASGPGGSDLDSSDPEE